MPTPKKEATVARLADLLGRSTVAILTDYRGLSVAEMSELRRRLRETGVAYHVVKNTLVLRAAQQAGKEGLQRVLGGPTAIAFGFGEVTAPAQVLVEYLRMSRTPLKIIGGVMDGRILTVEQVNALATLPPREQLMAMLLGQMQAPLLRLVLVLKGSLRRLVSVLEARRQQLEGVAQS